MKSFISSLLPAVLILGLAIIVNTGSINAQDNAPAETEGTSVVQAVQNNDKTTDFGELLASSGFVKLLEQQGPYTILAPNNEAISEKVDNVEEIKKDEEASQQLLQNHLYQGQVTAEQIESQIGVSIIETDESPSNGVIHVVDKVVERQ